MDLQNRLEELNIPIKQKLPDSSVLEPFLVFGGLSTDDQPSAKFGRAIDDSMFQIDIFLSIDIGKVEAEEIRNKAKQLIGKRRNVTSELLIDNTIGRETYHIPMRISELIY